MSVLKCNLNDSDIILHRMKYIEKYKESLQYFNHYLQRCLIFQILN